MFHVESCDSYELSLSFTYPQVLEKHGLENVEATATGKANRAKKNKPKSDVAKPKAKAMLVSLFFQCFMMSL